VNFLPSIFPAVQPARRYVAVCGASEASASQLEAAREVGRLLAEAGVVVVCGGLGGVMEAASEGAAEAGGLVVGLLPGEDRRLANPHVGVALATGLGQARNAVIACSADSVIAIGGGWGTLSEIGHARRLGRPVVGLDTWELVGLNGAATPQEAVRLALG
jgi:uncharacterized protein (TIGR00725 family)